MLSKSSKQNLLQADIRLQNIFNAVSKITKIQIEGSLLGVFSEAKFCVEEVDLLPGSKLVIFTDGLEQAFGNEEGETKLIDQISTFSNLHAEQLAESLSGVLDCQSDSLHPKDDITAVVIEAK